MPALTDLLIVRLPDGRDGLVSHMYGEDEREVGAWADAKHLVVDLGAAFVGIPAADVTLVE